MRCDFALQFLLLMIILSQTRAQVEDSTGLGNSTNKDTPTNNNGTGTDNGEASNRMPPTLPPSVSDTMGPTPSPSEALSATPDPYLLIRPLHNIQLSLFGPSLSIIQQEKLLMVLKSLLEKSLYLAMVEYFIPESVKKEELGSVFNRTNMTEEELQNLSILSKVFLEWTVTNSFIVVDNNSTSANSTDASNIIGEEEPKVHIVQARGSLGFKQYDYALLHPQTILPLQERIFAGGSNDSPMMSLSEIELALQMKGFSSLKVLQLLLVEAEEAVSPWDDDNEDENTDGKTDENEDDEHGASNTAVNDDDESTLYEDDDDDDDLGPKVGHPKRSASRETIAVASTVAGVVSAIALFLFLVFVRRKSQRIKKERLDRKQRASKKDDGITNEHDDRENNSTHQVSPISTSMFSGGTTTPDLSSKSTSSASVESCSLAARTEAPKCTASSTTTTVDSCLGPMTSPQNTPATFIDVETSGDIEVGGSTTISDAGENVSVVVDENDTTGSSTTTESSNEVGDSRAVSSNGTRTTNTTFEIGAATDMEAPR